METDALSLLSLFFNADVVVQAVMLGLCAASLFSWTVIFSKVLFFRRLFQKFDACQRDFGRMSSLESFASHLEADTPLADILQTAITAWEQDVKDGLPIDKTLERLDSVIAVATEKACQPLEQHIGFLASLGATAPFVGLFGTVWGIMHSFQSIAISQSTSLSVVAPAIAEALLATVMGLIAAIPAVVAYNAFADKLARYRTKVEIFSSEFLLWVEHQMRRARKNP